MFYSYCMMKKYLTLLLLSILSLSTGLQAEERIAGTLESVDLIIEDMYNEQGHNYGERYFAINRNDTPVRISIRLTEAKNAEDHFVPYTIVVKPLEKVKLGKVKQTDLTAESFWNYAWEVQPDQ